MSIRNSIFDSPILYNFQYRVLPEIINHLSLYRADFNLQTAENRSTRKTFFKRLRHLENENPTVVIYMRLILLNLNYIRILDGRSARI